MSQRPLYRRVIAEKLEPRILLSADAAAVLGSLSADPKDPAAQVRTLDADSTAAPSSDTALADSLLLQIAQDTRDAGHALQDTAPPQRANSIVFVDAAVAHRDELLKDIASDVEVVMLDAATDGLAQMTAYLSGRTGVTDIQVISEGAPGAIKLGNLWLDSANIGSRSAELQRVGQALAPDGDILFYGCRVAQTPDGQQLVQRLADITGADVAASDDWTGSAARGGDWTLEAQVGTISASPVLDAVSAAGYNDLLGTYVVTNTSDSGAGSLRQAILDANANGGADTINFAIGSGAQTISLLSALPAITGGVTIDGTSQPGFSGNPLIRLNGSAVTGAGLVLNAGASGSVIKGLVIGGFSSNGIELNGVSNVTISGNYIGTNPAGTAAAANGGFGISLTSTITDFSSNNVMGGTTAASRNVISGNTGGGISIAGSGTGNTVLGNYIGLSAAGTVAIANGADGIIVSSNSNAIGGAAAGAGNYISGNSNRGISLSGGNSNTIQGNSIGLGTDGSAIGNQDGIKLTSSASNNLIGGTTAGAGNVIASNSGAGVFVASSGSSGNQILGNSIYSNSNLGIDLTSSGVTANDAGDGDTGANGLQNFPVLSAASKTAAVGTLNSLASRNYRIEFFGSTAKDASGYGEGQRYLGYVDVTTNGSGNASFSATFSTSASVGDWISATATDLTASNTSEFAFSVQAVFSLTPIVTASGGTTAYTENGAASVDTGVTVSDADSGTLASATVSITANFASDQDVLAFTNNGSTMGNIGSSYNAGTGVLSLTSAGATATLAQWQAALRAVTYANSSDNPSTANRTVSFVVNDGSANSSASTQTVSVAAVNDAPVVTASGSTTAYTENGTALAIDSGVTVSDADNTTLASATVSITANFASGQDVLAFTNDGSTMGNIGASYNAGTGVLSLSSAGATATLAQWQAALRAVTYANSSDAPSTSNRTLSFVVNDGSTNSSASTKTLSVTAVNDAPAGTNKSITFTQAAGSYTFAAADFGFTDPLDSPANALSGVKISSLLGSGALTNNGATVNSGDTVSAADIALNRLVFTPVAGRTGAAYASFSFQVQDDGGTANGGVDLDASANTITLNVTPTDSTAAATYVVTNTNDSGAGSLRQAITNANTTTGSDTITFAIGSGAQTISLLSALPTVAGNLIIDGTSQPGYASTPLITLNGSSAGAGVNGLALNAAASGSTIKGLVINSFGENGINIQNASNVTLTGNYIGTDATGTVGLGNGQNGVRVYQSDHVVVGGTSPADRNVISGNGGTGVLLVESDSNTVIGNYIGTDATGTAILGNANDGVGIDTSNGNVIGGSTAAERNVISGNHWCGVAVYSFFSTGSTNNVISGNYIGLNASGAAALANHDDGVGFFTDATGNTVGGTTAGEGNVIAFNGNEGIAFWDDSNFSNALLGNSIYGNVQGGISFNQATSPTPNDAGDADTGANNLQNFPVITSATSIGSNTTLVGTLNSTASRTFRIEFFANTSADASGYGEAQRYLGFVSVTTNGSGNASFNTTLSAATTRGEWVSATATDQTTNDTSEFALSVQVPINHAPAGTDKTVTTLEDSAYTFTAADFGFSDPSEATADALLAVKITTLPGAGTLTNNGVAVTAGALVTVTDIGLNRLVFTPAANANVAAYASFTFQVQDDGGTANGGVDLDASANTITVDVTAVNDAPVVTASGGTTAYTEDGAALAVDSGVTVSDVDNTTFASATVNITANFASGQDLLAFTNNGSTMGNIGSSYNAGTGVLSLSSSGATATLAQWQAALRAVTYANSSDNPSTASRTVSFLVNDGNTNSAASTKTVSVTAVNDAPVVTASGGTTAYTENSAALALDTGVTVSDADSGTLTSATVSITGNFASGQDLLAFINDGSTMGNIAGSYNAGTGVLSLSSLGTTATLAEWQAALRAVTYANSSDSPSTANRTISFAVNDGSAGSLASTKMLSVTSVNDAPAGADNTVTFTQAAASHTFTVADFGFSDADGNSFAGVRITNLLGVGSLTNNGSAVNSGDTITAADIALNRLVFTAGAGSGAAYASFSFQVQDDGGTANGGVDLDASANTMTIDVTPTDSTAAITYVVTNTNDSGAGSLRQATTNANTTTGADTIGFAIGTGAQTINLLSALPAITGTLVLDGSTQPGYASTPLVTINGSAAGAGVNGLTLSAAASGSLIKGLVINGFGGDGIQLSSAANVTIVGNYIGTNSAGSAAVVNGGYGISLTAGADNTTIGGTTAALRNVLSGNALGGIRLASTGNVVLGSYIGLNAAGTAAVANGTYGVRILAGGNTIGGSAAGAGNVISGNTTHGLVFESAGNGTVQGNIIGLNAAGTAAVANTYNGILLYVGADNVTIGGAAAGQRNVVSGNGEHGILVQSSSGAIIQGNYVGLNAAGTAAVANGLSGIYLLNATSSTVGGSAAGESNVISGNTNYGVLSDSSTGSTIAGNIIGRNAANSAALGNGQNGIHLINSDNNLIGGSAAGAGNVISGSPDRGVRVFSGTGNQILGNAIFGNAAWGIDIGPAGVSANDAADADIGANNLQNFPVVSASQVISGATSITWSLNSQASRNYRIELFASTSAADGGRTYLGAVSTSTDGSGNASGTSSLLIVPSGQEWITATATDLTTGDTSEFSAAFQSVYAPVVTASGGTTAYTENGSALVVDAGVTVSDLDSGTLASATVSITGNFASGQDTLAFTNGGGMGNISASYNAGTGVLTLSSASATATLAEWQAALRAVTYANSSDNPSTANRTISFAANDGVAGSSASTKALSVAAVNDAPAGSDNTIVFAQAAGSYTFTAADFGFSDVDGSSFAGVRITNLLGLGSLANNGTAVNAGDTITATDIALNRLVFTPAAGGRGLAYASFSFQVQDNGGTANGGVDLDGSPNTMTLNVTPTDSTAATTYVVTTTNDSGAGSLRQAIINANTTTGVDTITFSIGSGAQTISVLSALPSITDRVTIDATTQPGYAGTPLIVLNGSGVNAHGINVTSGGSNSVIRGFVINQFIRSGIALDGASGVTIAGNYIGTNAGGAAASANGSHGVEITNGASNNIIGGTSTSDRNVISGNGGEGIRISNASLNNAIQGNYIGTNAAGTTAIGNGGSGVYADSNSTGTTIGGTSAGARNVISGSVHHGIEIRDTATGTQILGNYIGTNATGTAALGNSWSGINIDGSSNNSIGGTTAGAGNLISGNGQRGIDLFSASSNTIQGNSVGTNAAGTSALANGLSGLEFGNTSSNNLVGGTTAAARNVISGNTGSGVTITSGTNNTFRGNYIGLDAAGTSALANGDDGMTIATDGNTVGGTAAGAGNYISGNANRGISLAGANNNTIQGNYIGVGSNGAAIGNQDGIKLTSSASGNLIGGTVAGAGNVVANNSGAGVFVASSGSQANQILGNSIYANSSIGIDLTSSGVTANDAGDADTGANNLQNFPVITAAQSNASTTSVQGSLNSAASRNFRIEFFASTSRDASNYGEGQSYLGFVNVTTDGSGNASFSTSVLGTSSNNQWISATATDLTTGDTSEFALSVQATAIPVVTASGGASSYSSNGTPTVIDSGITVSDADSATLASATVSITANFSSGNDVLAFTNDGSTMGNISAVYNAGTGVLSLSSASATATLAQWQAALRAVTYVETSGTPSTASRTVSFQVNDGAANSSASTKAVNVAVTSYIVTNTNDSGLGSLRQAITDANANPGANTISFGIGSGAKTITLGSALPDITETVTIDASTQPGYAGVPLIELNGASVNANGITILAGGSNSTIRGLVINGFGQAGIALNGVSGVTITGNYIGTNAAGTAAIANTGDGILLDNASTGNTIGGILAGDGNIIAFNGDRGIRLGTGTGNLVSGNRIHSNSSLGIDIEGDGVTANDAGDGDAGGNNRQNFPVLSAATASTVSGTLNSAPSRNYRIEFFASVSPDASNHGEGQRYLGYATVSTDGSGNAAFVVTLTIPAAGEDWVSATAIDLVTNDTSEFSLGVQVPMNHEPTGADNTISIAEDAVYTFTVGDFGFSDVDGHQLALIYFTTLPAQGTLQWNGNAFAAGNYVVASDINAGLLTYVPAPNASGASLDSFTFQVQDDGGTAGGGVNLDATPNTMTINVSAVNDAPAGTSKTVTFAQAAGSYTFSTADFGFSDPLDSPADQFSGVRITGLLGAGSLANNGVAINSGDIVSAADIALNRLVFTPGAGGSGTAYASFSFQVQDDGSTAAGGVSLDASPKTMTLTVTPTDSTAPTTYVVTNTNDSGAGSLRQAIINANTTIGTDTITFNIGSGAQTILIASALPTITDKVVINGTTQSGYVSTPLIEIDGTAAGAGSSGLQLTSGASGSAVAGLVINRFGSHGIYLNGASNVTITGNYVGTDAAGTAAAGNGGNGITLTNSTGNQIGGTTAAARNVVSGNTLSGISLSGTSGSTTIQGNYIGTDATGSVAVGNQIDGVLVSSTGSGNTIGGNAAGAGNVISGNAQRGISVDGSSANVIQGNYIGTNAAGTSSLANTLSGIDFIGGAGGNTVGGTAAGAGNLIAYNGSAGVKVTSGRGETITGNSIHSNTGLGIDLGAIGVTGNDAGDGDTGANGLQNFPVLTGVYYNALATVVSGTLNSKASTSFRVDFYYSTGTDSTGHGEGQTYVGSAVVNTDSGGNATFSASVNVTSASVGWISATATDLGTGDTSEFSQSAQATHVNSPPNGTDATVVTPEDSPYVFTAADFGFSDALDSPGNALSGVKIATAPSGGTLYNNGVRVLSGTTVSKGDIDAGLLIFSPTASLNGAGAASFTFQVQDDGGTANGGTDLDATLNTLTINITAVNDAPVASTSGSTTAYTENGSPLAIDPGLSVSDVDNTTFASAAVSITGNFASGQDVLAFLNDGSTMGNITASYDAATGVLSMTSAGASATLAQWQAALRAVTYANNADNPAGGARTVSFAVNDGTGDSPAATKTLNVALVDNAPTPASPSGTPGVSLPVPTSPASGATESDNATKGSTGSGTNAPATQPASPPVSSPGDVSTTAPASSTSPSQASEQLTLKAGPTQALGIRLSIDPASDMAVPLVRNAINIAASRAYVRNDIELKFDIGRELLPQASLPTTDSMGMFFLVRGDARRHASSDADADADMEAPTDEDHDAVAVNVRWAAEAAATISVTWGLLRLAGLAASAVASRPVWQHMDPIPLLHDGGDATLHDGASIRPDDDFEQDEIAARHLLDEIGTAHEA